jgi:hypothetical protein
MAKAKAKVKVKAPAAPKVKAPAAPIVKRSLSKSKPAEEPQPEAIGIRRQC